MNWCLLNFAINRTREHFRSMSSDTGFPVSAPGHTATEYAELGMQRKQKHLRRFEDVYL